MNPSIFRDLFLILATCSLAFVGCGPADSDDGVLSILDVATVVEDDRVEIAVSVNPASGEEANVEVRISYESENYPTLRFTDPEVRTDYEAALGDDYGFIGVLTELAAGEHNLVVTAYEGDTSVTFTHSFDLEVALTSVEAPPEPVTRKAFYLDCVGTAEDLVANAHSAGCMDATTGGVTLDGTFNLLGSRAPDGCPLNADLDLDLTTDEIRLGLARADSGHVIDLGAEAPFDILRWGTTSAEIGTTLSDDQLRSWLYTYENPEPALVQDRMTLTEGHSYLLRFAAEEYEVFAKWRVDTIGDAGVEISYEQLRSVPPTEFCGRRADAYQVWLDGEPSAESGTATLYDRGAYGDHIKATFNSVYATRDLLWVTDNRWDTIYEDGELRGLAVGDRPTDEFTIAGLGTRDLATVVRADADDATFGHSVMPSLGETYYIRSVAPGYEAEVALQVVSVDDDSLTYNWRRLSGYDHYSDGGGDNVELHVGTEMLTFNHAPGTAFELRWSGVDGNILVQLRSGPGRRGMELEPLYVEGIAAERFNQGEFSARTPAIIHLQPFWQEADPDYAGGMPLAHVYAIEEPGLGTTVWALPDYLALRPDKIGNTAVRVTDSLGRLAHTDLDWVFPEDGISGTDDPDLLALSLPGPLDAGDYSVTYQTTVNATTTLSFTFPITLFNPIPGPLLLPDILTPGHRLSEEEGTQLYPEHLLPYCYLVLSDTDPAFIPEGPPSVADGMRSGTGDYDGNTLSYTATIVSDPLAPQIITFSLDGSSEPGFALNAGNPDEDLFNEPDAYFSEADNPHLIILADGRSAMTPRPVLSETATVRFRDYGAFGTITAGACTTEMREYPVDENDNAISDAATLHDPGDADEDEDKELTGRSTSRGDGLSRYEEYRGFFVKGTHTRTNPDEMDLFQNFSDTSYEGRGWVNLHLVNQFVSEDEMNGFSMDTVPGFINPVATVRTVNFNYHTAHIVDQHALYINMDHGGRGRGNWGIALTRCADLRSLGGRAPADFECIDIYLGNAAYPRSGGVRADAARREGSIFTSDGSAVVEAIIDWLITHEILHGVGLKHHFNKLVINHATHAGEIRDGRLREFIGVWDDSLLDMEVPFDDDVCWEKAHVETAGTPRCPLRYPFRDIDNSIWRGEGWTSPLWSPSEVCSENINQFTVSDVHARYQ